MLIINKKKILFVICATILSFAFYGYNTNNEGINKDIVNTKLVNTIPVTNKSIIIDAGHGFPDGGAVGNSGTIESEVNLKIALKLQKLLEESGSTVILTRSDENGIYDNDSDSISKKKVSDIQNRVKLGNNSSADIFVSIHLNKIEQEEYSGWQTFYQKDNEKSKKLADLIQNNINKNIQIENNRKTLPISQIYIMDNVKIPTVIVECGFLSNAEEAKLLQQDDYQNRLVNGIYNGIIKYFQN